MYSELGEDLNFDTSVVKKIEPENADPSQRRVIGGKKNINKSSDLRKSLIGDVETGTANQSSSLSPNNSLVGSNDDPYYVFKEDLLSKLDIVEDSLRHYERVVKHTDTSVNKAQVKEDKKQLKRHLKNAEATLHDVQTTVRMVEKNRAKFLDIDQEELSARKHFTEICKRRINEARDGMNSQSIKTKMLKDQRSLTKRRLGLSNSQSIDDKNEESMFIEDSHASAQLMMEQQEETLDELDGAVVRVSHMAENIHEELNHQNKMLNELQDDLQNAEEQLGLVMGKLAKMLKTKNKCHLGTIIILSIVAIVLFFLVIYT